MYVHVSFIWFVIYMSHRLCERVEYIKRERQISPRDKENPSLSMTLHMEPIQISIWITQIYRIMWSRKAIKRNKNRWCNTQSVPLIYALSCPYKGNPNLVLRFQTSFIPFGNRTYSREGSVLHYQVLVYNYTWSYIRSNI